ncbi:MAG TPA: ATP-binding protein, partial [Longimicrobium sp.]|nr:ATP-binding protein [Longimicrobium sp.]
MHAFDAALARPAGRGVMRRLSPGTLPEPRRLLGWVYLGRVTLAGAIFIAAAWAWTDAPPQATLAASLIMLAAGVFTAVSFWYTHVVRRAPGRGYLYGQVIFDVLLVTAVVHLTGGRDSSFAPLFVLVIVAGAILLPILGGILVGLLATVLYFGDVVWSAHSLDGRVLLQLALFTTVALVTGYIGDRLRQTGAVLGEVETELRLLRLDTDDILAGIGTGILTVDGEGRLGYINPAASELLGIEAHRWLGKPVLDALDRIAPGMGAIIRASAEERAGIKRFETAEGQGGMVLGVSTTLLERDGALPPSVTAIFQDITERKRIELLRRRAERLEAVAELSASLAHEIKNPLASIRSASEQLTGGALDADDKRVLQDLVVRESERLSRLLTEFIDFARVKLRAPHPLHVAALAKHALDVARANPAAAGQELRLVVDESAAGALVRGDEDLLHRAVLNLALNAVQWAGPGGTVEVAVDAMDAEILSSQLASRRAVRVRVSDTGPGVPPEDVENVFDPFFTQRPGGTGLGLALVQRAAEAHGGAVYVDEPRGEGWGATFTLYLPALGDEDTAES